MWSKRSNPEKNRHGQQLTNTVYKRVENAIEVTFFKQETAKSELGSFYASNIFSSMVLLGECKPDYQAFDTLESQHFSL